MGVPSMMNSSNKYTAKASADDVSLDSATTSADKNEKLVLSPAKRRNNNRNRSALRRPVLLSNSPSPSSSSPSSCHIRHRYLAKLGVADAASSSPSNKSSTLKSFEKIRPALRTADSKSKKNKAQPSNTVRFDDSQISTIQYIPDKRGLPYRDLWIQKDEFTELFQRNCLEYAADGWNWETATEEHDFVYFQNELVHPAHFRRGLACGAQRHFLMTMYAQRQHDQSRNSRIQHAWGQQRQHEY